MDEDRRRRWDFDKRIRENTIAGLRAASRAGELSDQIDRREWHARADTYLAWLTQATASVVAELSNAQVLLSTDRQRWCRHLREIDLTSSHAATELADVLSEVRAKQQFWSSLGRDIDAVDPPGWPAEVRGSSAPDESSNPVELMLSRRDAERKRKLTQEAAENERALASIASALEHVITLHQGYELARSRS